MSVDLFGALKSLERQLDYHARRHEVLASNLANAETPGYRDKELVFASSLGSAQQLLRSDPRHLGGSAQGGFKVVEAEAPGGVSEGVRLERAMARISANRLRYETAIELVRKRLALLRYTAMGGGR